MSDGDAAAKRERHAESLRKAKIAFKLMNLSPEEQARLYELLNVRA